MSTIVPELNPGFQFWEENAGQSPSGGWTDALAVTSKALPAGNYKISWSMELRVVPNGPLNSEAQARASINSNEKAQFIYGGTNWHTVSGFDFQKYGMGATPNIVVEFKRLGGNDTVEIRKVKLSLERVDG